MTGLNLWLPAVSMAVVFGGALLGWRRAVAIPCVVIVAAHLALTHAFLDTSHSQKRIPILDDPGSLEVWTNPPLIEVPHLPPSPDLTTNEAPVGVPEPGEFLAFRDSNVLDSLPVASERPRAELGLPPPDREPPPIDPVRWKRAEDADTLIRRRLEAAGGQEGVVTVTLVWFTGDDLDLHVRDPNGRLIFWSTPEFSDRIKLDVDRNRSDTDLTTEPIENVRWLATDEPPVGTYHVFVDHYRKRSEAPARFLLRVLINGSLVALMPGEVAFSDQDFTNPELNVYQFHYAGSTP